MKILSMYYLQRACIDVTPYNNLFIFLRVCETCRRHLTIISLLSYDRHVGNMPKRQLIKRLLSYFSVHDNGLLFMLELY
jgi:hypothetical protein